MSIINQDVLEYMSGLTGFVFDKAVLVRTALDRGIQPDDTIDSLPLKVKDLILADLLLTAYLSPNVWASHKKTHGNFSESFGQQSMFTENKQQIYDFMYNIYKKYDDPKIEMLDENLGTVQFLDI